MDSEAGRVELLGVETSLADVMHFLDGVSPLDGCMFGEHPAGMGAFWWRAHLRQAFASFERDLRADNGLREALDEAAGALEAHERLLRSVLAAIDTGRSEPLFIVRDQLRNFFADQALSQAPR